MVGRKFDFRAQLVGLGLLPEGPGRGIPPQDPPPAPTFSVPDLTPALPEPRIVVQPTAALTACLNSAEHPATARRLFQVLHELALHTVRARGLGARPHVAVFHLPLELLAAHLGVDRTTVWRNLQPLKRAGVLDERDHYGTLRGGTAVTGKVWAVAVAPERVLQGRAAPVKVTRADLAFPWRDLTRDAERGRTAYALTRTDERQNHEKALREARVALDPERHARAAQRLAEREAARAAGERPARGRTAATLNAATTRSAKAATQKAAPTRQKSRMQQSMKGLKAVGQGELLNWALAPFSDPSPDVTQTVARGPAGGLGAVFTLPTLGGLAKRDRGAAVEEVARSLAVSFEDTDNLRFWAWLVWQLLRGADQGQDWTDDVVHILVRVLHDIRHDETMRARSQRRPGALVVNELRNAGLLDALRNLPHTRVGARPRPN